MKLRVLVIYKESAFQIYARNRRLRAHIERSGPAAEAAWRTSLFDAHEKHQSAVAEVRRFLAQCKNASVTWRHRSTTKSAKNFDTIIALGGDGTALEASRLAGPKVPIVCINTAPGSSTGFFCAGKGAATVALALAGNLPTTFVRRMQVKIDKKIISKRVLNDVLFCHENPAATSRYRIFYGLRHEEVQKSSGVWIGTGAGSTGATLSAGGQCFPVDLDKLQFVVREPCDPFHKLSIRSGLVSQIQLESHMRDGWVYLDGSRVRKHVGMGSILTCEISDEPLMLLGFKGWTYVP